jgi:hypothetical protein
MRRWSDNDHIWGPFLFAYSRTYRPIAIELQSADDEDWGDGQRSSSLRFSAFGCTLIITLPAIVKPHMEKVYPTSWDQETVHRLGRNWYWNIDRRSFGFSYSDGFLQVFRGRRTHDSSTDRSWGCFLPWTQWRHVRHSMYDTFGHHFWTRDAARAGQVDVLGSARAWSDDWQAAKAAVPKQHFRVRDLHDGEELTATCFIEEREWRFGEGYFKWLSWFRRRKIERTIDIAYSTEVGKRKGSWKGGTIGCGAKMERYDTILSAFLRHCRKGRDKLEFLDFDFPEERPAGPIPTPPDLKEALRGLMKSTEPRQAWANMVGNPRSEKTVDVGGDQGAPVRNSNQDDGANRDGAREDIPERPVHGAPVETPPAQDTELLGGDRSSTRPDTMGEGGKCPS